MEEEKIDKKLLTEITDEELSSLDCPAYSQQEEEWSKIDKFLTKEKLELLFNSLNYELINFEFYKNTLGVINKIYIIKAKNYNNNNEINELILRINNPHLFWKNKRNRNEVSIMKYINEHTNIPIPLILSFSNNTKDSLLGCEYILMEKIKGITLSSFLENKIGKNYLIQL